MNHIRLILYCSAFLFITIPILYFGLKYKGTDKLTPQEAIKEYKEEAASLKLAPGWKWPDIPLPSKTPNGNEVRYEEGYATAQADSYWFCSWISRATDSKLSESERQEALKNALTIRSKYFYTTSLAPESKPPFEQMF